MTPFNEKGQTVLLDLNDDFMNDDQIIIQNRYQSSQPWITTIPCPKT